ncbi:MAG: hypothetical protein H0V89_09195 [Deltaproteobacteria bacterium]|nr:hypothetical protein [Deltaproteobacteria bacterium]
MIEDLRPLGLVEAARRLRIDPFELVRIEVGLGNRLERLTFAPERLAVLARDGGIETSWLDETRLQATPAVRVREAFGELARRGFVGDKSTRLDNLTRGLSLAEADTVRRASPQMAEEGLLLIHSGPLGALVSVQPGQEARLAAVAAGTTESRGLLQAMTE